MEIEKKFLVNDDILMERINLNEQDRIEIDQAYISVEGTEVRVRKIEDACEYKCYMTLKSNGNLIRKEVEFEIPYIRYRDIIGNKLYTGHIIEKLRYKIPLENGLIAELDVYGGRHFGLVVVEVEFKNEEEANNFQKPDWFGEEVTENENYKNKNLSTKSATYF